MRHILNWLFRFKKEFQKKHKSTVISDLIRNFALIIRNRSTSFDLKNLNTYKLMKTQEKGFINVNKTFRPHKTAVNTVNLNYAY